MHWEVDLILKKVMARSNCLVNSNSSEVKRFMKTIRVLIVFLVYVYRYWKNSGRIRKDAAIEE